MKVIALDLDGVLVNSAPECWLVLRLSSPDLVPEGLREAWLAERGRCRIVADFLRLASALRDGVSLDPRGGLSGDLPYPPDVEERVARFYETRERLRDEDPEAWFGLHATYPGMPEAVAALQERGPVYVATSKNEAASRALLARFKFRIAGEHVLGRERGDGKAALLRLVARAEGAEPEEILFVDDHLPNLRDAAAIGARCVLAGWGYGGPGEREQARSEGYSVISIPDLGRLW